MLSHPKKIIEVLIERDRITETKRDVDKKNKVTDKDILLFRLQMPTKVTKNVILVYYSGVCLYVC